MKKLYFREEWCVGCGRCEVACAIEHSESKHPVISYFFEKVRQTPRIIVERKGNISFANTCRHCEEPDCVNACISGALYKDLSGKILYDPAKCVGCYSCIMACPYGAIMKDLNRKERKQIVKCDLCNKREGGPACVEACPNRAIVFEERGE
ncbi:MAG TPA: 4Fe-4S dicluster domain-containing protein [Spirochaetota bacterium]|nr:4Fe-4S dicluster domain-containing protein [Spirochaetota bacterium]HPQ48755.1 4Fe-4S dicluster domain-containing protein [Spirochaetota bacterium]